MFEDLIEGLQLEDTNWTGFAILYGMVIVVLWLMDFSNYFSVFMKAMISLVMIPIVFVILKMRSRR